MEYDLCGEFKMDTHALVCKVAYSKSTACWHDNGNKEKEKKKKIRE